MQIYLNDTPLARGKDYAESPTNFTILGQRQVQTTPTLRAPAIYPRQRGNFLTTLRFSVTRLHASIHHALTFALAHASALSSSSGTARFLPEDDSAAPQPPLLLQHAVLRTIRATVSGLTTTHDYELLGSLIASK